MTPQRVQEILDGFQGRKVLVVGDVVLDRYVSGVVERLNPEAPVPILAAKKIEEMTGGAGNVAKNLATLGAEAVLVSTVGSDVNAEHLADQAKREQYRPEFVTDSSRPTIQKVRFMVRNQMMLRVDYEEIHDIAGDIEDAVIARVQQAMADGVEGVLVSDYAKGVVTENVAKAVMEAAGKAGVPVAVDAKPSRIGFFKGAAFISPNRKEAHEILGWSEHERGGRAPKGLVEGLQEQLETDVFLTLSADGVYVFTRDGFEQHVSQEHVVEVADPSGAGDTAIAALMLAKLAGANAEEMAVLLNAAGASVVQKIGSVGVSVSEVRDMLTHKHEI